MPQFNLKDYQPVEERIALFWAKYPNGRLLTEIVFDDGERVVVKAEVYTDRDDARPAASDFAEEVKGDGVVNKTSRIENCATSATGRALATLGFSPKGKRPSREEMESVERKNSQPPSPKTQPVNAKNQALLDRLNALPDDIRKDAKVDFINVFGHPFEVAPSKLQEAEEFVAMLETPEEPW